MSISPSLISATPNLYAPVAPLDAVNLYKFLKTLQPYEEYEFIYMHVFINMAHNEFEQIYFTTANSVTGEKQVHVLEDAFKNTALMPRFQSYYLLKSQRDRKRDTISFSPTYWMKQLEQEPSVFAYLRIRKLEMLIS